MQFQLFFIFFLLLSSVNSPYTMCCAHSAQWFQIAKTRHKISSIDVISRVFPSKFQQIHIYFHFRGIRFTLRNCQTVAGISTVCQFHDFLKSNFWRVFDIWPNCAMHRGPVLFFWDTLYVLSQSQDQQAASVVCNIRSVFGDVTMSFSLVSQRLSFGEPKRSCTYT